MAVVQVDLDIDRMRAHMAVWREMATLRPYGASPVSTEDRAKLLMRAAATAEGWLDLLRMCSADGARLEPLKREVAAFEAWAREGGEALKLLRDAERPFNAPPR
jgi:hypothetical protein